MAEPYQVYSSRAVTPIEDVLCPRCGVTNRVRFQIVDFRGIWERPTNVPCENCAARL